MPRDSFHFGFKISLILLVFALLFINITSLVPIKIFEVGRIAREYNSNLSQDVLLLAEKKLKHKLIRAHDKYIFLLIFILFILVGILLNKGYGFVAVWLNLFILVICLGVIIMIYFYLLVVKSLLSKPVWKSDETGIILCIMETIGMSGVGAKTFTGSVFSNLSKYSSLIRWPWWLLMGLVL